MTRKEYDLIFQAFKSYRPFMTDAEEVLSEKILDDLFYPHFDKLSTDDDFENDCFDENGMLIEKDYFKNVSTKNCKYCEFKDKPDLCDRKQA